MDTMDKTQQVSRTIPCSNCGEMYSVTYKKCPFCGGPPLRKRPEKSSRRERPDKSEGADRQARLERPERQVRQKSTERVDPVESQVLPLEAEPAVRNEPPVEADVPAEAALPDSLEYTLLNGQEEFALEVEMGLLPEIPEDEPVAAPEEHQLQPRHGERRGGRRLQSRGPSAGRVLLFLISLAIIAAAIYIVVTKVAPYIQEALENRQGAGQQDPGGTPGAQDPNGVGEGEDGLDGAQSEGFYFEEETVTLLAQGQSKALVVSNDAGDGPASLLWSSSNPEVASVDSDGVVTAVSVGVATITVTRSDGGAATCQVQCSWNTGTVNSNLSLNKTDFTLGPNDPNVTMRVIGTEEAPVWESANPEVATISENGVVKYVSKGTTNVTATVDGQTLSCIVRCS